MNIIRTDLMTAALSMTPTDQLSAYNTVQLRDAALDAEPRLLAQLANEPCMTDAERREWIDRVRALNIISAEVLRRERRDAALSPSLVAEVEGVRLTLPVMCF